MRIEVYTKGDKLPELIDGTVMHSAFIFRTTEKLSSCKPYMLVAYDEEGKEIGHLMITRRNSFTLLPPHIKFWYTINGEGVYRKECPDRERIFSGFLNKVFGMFDIRHSYIEIQDIEDSRFAYGTLSGHDFVPIRDQRMYISIHSKSPQERISRAYRAHIRKAEKTGVTYRQATGKEEIETGLRLLKNYYRSKTRRKLPPQKSLEELLTDRNSENSGNAKLFIVYFKGKAIGSSICIYDKKRAYLAYSCGLRKRYPLQYPGIMAIWAALKDAYDNRFPHFEFLEARNLSRIHYNFRHTLLNYGCKQVGTFKWYHYKWNLLNKILRAIYV